MIGIRCESGCDSARMCPLVMNLHLKQSVASFRPLLISTHHVIAILLEARKTSERYFEIDDEVREENHQSCSGRHEKPRLCECAYMFHFTS